MQRLLACLLGLGLGLLTRPARAAPPAPQPPEARSFGQLSVGGGVAAPLFLRHRTTWRLGAAALPALTLSLRLSERTNLAASIRWTRLATFSSSGASPKEEPVFKPSEAMFMAGTTTRFLAASRTSNMRLAADRVGFWAGWASFRVNPTTPTQIQGLVLAMTIEFDVLALDF